jgi:transposase
MKDSITWVGMDDSANKINVAVFYGDEAQPRNEFVVVNDDSGVGRLIQKLKAMPGQVRCVYEAGVSGYDLHRALAKYGIHCDVAAPSLTPRRAGKRVKTDPRDAKDLAKLYRSGELTSIVIPETKQESVRDLLRAREDALEDQQRARHRLARFLFRRGLRYRTGKAWTRGHLQWIRAVHFEDTAAQSVLQEYRLALEEQMERLARFEKEILEVANAPEYQKLASCLMGLRGVKVLTAMTIIAESIDLKRFTGARAFMAAIGLVGSEYSSGGSEHRGGITKAGNSHMRRVAIESSWHYRHPVTVGGTLQKRREGLPAEVLTIVRKADKRLHKKYWHLVNKGKDARTAIVAVSRELAGFIWAIGQVVA